MSCQYEMKPLLRDDSDGPETEEFDSIDTLVSLACLFHTHL